MRANAIRAYLSCALATTLLAGASVVAAQTVQPPPQLEPDTTAPNGVVPPVDDANPEPEITIRQHSGNKIEEYRIHGRLYMIKITPSIGRPYYLIDPKGDGSFVRRDGIDKGLVIPSWVLLHW